MASRIHETINGLRVEYPEPDPKVARFLARVLKLASEGASEDALVEVVYSDKNPILEPSPFGGRGMVTRAVLENPVWTVLMDIVERCRLVERGVNIDELASEYTITVAEAAELAGVNASAIRQAIQAGRLPAWMRGRQLYLHPQYLRRYAAELGQTRRGPAPVVAPLDVCVGSAPGLSFSIKGADIADPVKAGKKITGQVRDWKSIAVGWGSKKDRHFRLIVPDKREREIREGDFFVKGPFRVLKSKDGAAEAGEAWGAFEAAS